MESLGADDGSGAAIPLRRLSIGRGMEGVGVGGAALPSPPPAVPAPADPDHGASTFSRRAMPIPSLRMLRAQTAVIDVLD